MSVKESVDYVDTQLKKAADTVQKGLESLMGSTPTPSTPTPPTTPNQNR